MHSLPSGLFARAVALVALALLASPLRAQLAKLQDGLLYPGNRHPAFFPHDARLADLDSDGDLDLVSVEPISNTLVVRHNLGFGTLAYQVEWYIDLPPLHQDRLELGDHDGDGDVDILQVGTGTLLRLNDNHAGSIQVGIEVPMVAAGSDNRGLALGNIVAGGGEETVVLAHGQGSDVAVVVKGFVPSQTLTLPGVTDADFPLVLDTDGDHDDDLLFADTLGKTLLHAAGTGAGLLPAVSLASLSAPPTALAAGPLNADAWPDMVAAMGPGSLALLLSTGPAAWSVHEQPLLLGGAGDAALVAAVEGTPTVLVVEHDAQRLELLHLAGSELHLDAALHVGSGPQSLAAGELDGDGHLDLAIAHSGLDAPLFEDGDIWLLHGDANGSFPVPLRIDVPASPRAIVAADFDLDGHADLASLSGNGALAVVLGDGAGGFSPPVASALGPGGTSLAAGDMDVDGDVDLVSPLSPQSAQPKVVVLLNDGAAAFTPLPGVPAAATGPVASIALGPMDGDEFPDVVAAAGGPGAFTLLRGGPGGVLAAPTTWSMNPGTNAVAIGDLNEDGQLDVATADAGAQTLSWRAGHGDGTFGPHTFIAVEITARNVALGDVDVDGLLDVLGTGFLSEYVSVHRNEGDGVFGFAGLATTGREPTAIIVADVNGDSRPDIVTSEEYQHDVAVALSDGAGGYGWPQFFAAGRDAAALALADFDEDGNPDLATADPGSGTLTVLIHQSHWTDGGLGLAGTHGTPKLSGSGHLFAGEPIGLTLVDARENSSATLVVGLSLLAAPFKGGVLGPSPDVLLAGFGTGSKGKVELPATWPDGLPSGFTVWAQWWIVDPAGAKGFAASNVLAGKVP